ncbi:hypothetical protein L227DRAFT_616978 [Lentinus tigrinus ALCF2SS1-6]|uniref:Acetyl-CoA carboxylase BT domain-containing protein n=1 Tax=Lentinus tigrinus ALCF2SS1-6 TaxID=1328759 RepID=A0A5C2RSJ2_9APHY|nr:hypothetical protein L227DRAFT_616978 [Lentinus tigrinus ALCF2SS1-6]
MSESGREQTFDAVVASVRARIAAQATSEQQWMIDSKICWEKCVSLPGTIADHHGDAVNIKDELLRVVAIYEDVRNEFDAMFEACEYKRILDKGQVPSRDVLKTVFGVDFIYDNVRYSSTATRSSHTLRTLYLNGGQSARVAPDARVSGSSSNSSSRAATTSTPSSGTLRLRVHAARCLREDGIVQFVKQPGVRLEPVTSSVSSRWTTLRASSTRSPSKVSFLAWDHITVLHNPELPISEEHPLFDRLGEERRVPSCIKKLIDHFLEENIRPQDRATGGLKTHETNIIVGLLARYEEMEKLMSPYLVSPSDNPRTRSIILSSSVDPYGVNRLNGIYNGTPELRAAVDSLCVVVHDQRDELGCLPYRRSWDRYHLTSTVVLKDYAPASDVDTLHLFNFAIETLPLALSVREQGLKRTSLQLELLYARLQSHDTKGVGRAGAGVTAADEEESLNVRCGLKIDDRHGEKRSTLALEDEVESIGAAVEDPSVVEGASVLLEASVVADDSKRMERGLRIEDSHEENRSMLEEVIEDAESVVEIGVGVSVTLADVESVVDAETELVVDADTELVVDAERSVLFRPRGGQTGAAPAGASCPRRP